MTIALFSDSYLPTKSGIVTVVTQLRDQLLKAGHKVILVCPETTKEYATDNPDIYRVKSVPLGLGTDQFLTMPNLHALVSYMKTKDIQLIHCHTEFGIGKAGIHVAKKLGIPAICTLHTMWTDFYKYYLPGAKFISPSIINKVMKDIYKHFDALIGVSTKAKKYFQQPGMLPNMPSVVIPNSIDREKFQATHITAEEKHNLREKYDIKDSDVVFLFLGRIAEEKRVFELAEKCKILVEKCPNAKVLFVGSGPFYADLYKACEKQILAKTFIFTGYVEWNEVHKYYEASDVFITASLSEMHSMTILEAELSALPIAARMDDSYLDCIFPNQNGYLASNDDELLENMIEMAQNEEKRKEYGKKSLEITKTFTIEKYMQKTLLMYNEVIKAYPEKIDEKAVCEKIEKL